MPQPRRKQQNAVVAPKTTVQLGGNDYRVHFSFDGLARIEELLDVNVLTEPLSNYLAASVKNLTTILWAGLIHHHPDLDTDDPQDGIRQVRKLMSVPDGIAYINAINQAFTRSMPEPDPDAPLGNDASPSDGATSGASAASTSGSTTTNSGS